MGVLFQNYRDWKANSQKRKADNEEQKNQPSIHARVASDLLNTVQSGPCVPSEFASYMPMDSTEREQDIKYTFQSASIPQKLSSGRRTLRLYRLLKCLCGSSD